MTSDRATEPNFVSAIAGLLLLGAALGTVQNALEQRAGRGLPWIGAARLSALGAAPEVQAAPVAPAAPTDDSDPLAIPAAAGELPTIPEVGRPVQVELAALAQLVGANAVLVVDAREAEEYAEGHIPGAINLPPGTAHDPAKLEALETGGRPIVTYCGGGSCELSLTLAWALHDVGHTRVAVFMAGFPQWVAAGHPVKKGSGA